MEYIYAALLLDSAGKEISESSLESVVKAAGIEPNQAMAKAVVSSLKGVSIKDVMKNAQTAQVAAAPATGAAPAAKAEAKHEEAEKVSEEQAAGGLASLFG
ncbi:MAG: 50S ribosomal protein P1 [Candidatus Marsarchaeota archaeon]|nr:50S ribosomal protein P1 [Candidatus Marsarchaeota archaeon]